jgi:uroporphyrin-III C-methyltransferase / precorrin-2 dehydrogenase / sirohydrochlorin ferrochelatase
MRYFPIFVDLQGRTVVVVGGGEEAVRKIRLLKKTTARIKVIAPELHVELQNGAVDWVGQVYSAELLNGAALVYSADKSLNAIVSADAQAKGIPINAVDEADISTFIVPSIVDRDPVVVAIGTEGTAPVLGQNIRAKIDQLLAPQTGALATAASKLRPRVAETVPAGNRRRSFWRSFFFGEPREAFLSGDSVAFELAVGDALFADVKPAVGKISVVSIASDDLDDLTLGSHRLLQEADVIVVDGLVAHGILETARRDAVRVTVNSGQDVRCVLREHAEQGLHVVHLRRLRTPYSAEIVPFPIREDIRDAALRSVS